MKTTLIIPEELHEQLRVFAFEQRISISELIRRAVIEYLKKGK